MFGDGYSIVNDRNDSAVADCGFGSLVLVSHFSSPVITWAMNADCRYSDIIENVHIYIYMYINQQNMALILVNEGC